MGGFCSNCAAALEPGGKFCPSCGAPAAAPAPPVQTMAHTLPAPAPSIARPAPGTRRYPALRIIAIIFKVFAVVCVVGGIIAGIAMTNTPYVGGGGVLLGLIFGVSYGLGLWAFAELIHVLIDIEENTRLTIAK